MQYFGFNIEVYVLVQTKNEKHTVVNCLIIMIYTVDSSTIFVR